MRRLQVVIRRARCKLDNGASPEFNQPAFLTTFTQWEPSVGQKYPLSWAGFGTLDKLASIQQRANGLGACIDVPAPTSYKFDAHHERRRQGHVKIVRRN